ncbi:hypothetical protein CON24_19320 [Bacillus cereus]|uniref:TetR/AcrR family transcriptional regulator n=1 Tax=Bacillus cereus TaxID=1396 RepID=UPI000BED9DF8|nr:TetR/AcrR family transcriptional regulator [Bacillus cereus]PED36183.1 hypothetical protein CON24_19320 [Bacillus cereus]
MSISITRQKILAAASQIVQCKGVAKLTLEAVAKEAGLSKDGLWYSEYLGVGRLSPELREKVIQALISNSYK